MYSRLQLQLDEVMKWSMIYGRFSLSLFSRSFQRSVSKHLPFSVPLIQEIVSICDMVLMCSKFTGPPACDDLINHFLHAIVEQLNLRKWWAKEKGWNKDSLAIYWLVWEQRMVCRLLVSSKDPVSHSVQASADRNLFVEMHSKCLSAALNWQLRSHK